MWPIWTRRRTRPAPLTVAALCEGTDGGRFVGSCHYNGKIERPVVANRPLSGDEMWALKDGAVTGHLCDSLVAVWDFSRDMAGDRIVDLSPNGLHGRAVNLPARAMKGHNWSGEFQSWQSAPQEYGAIHFHEDDLYDAGWETDFELTVPADLGSGVYAARLADGEEEEHIPFFVRPPAGTSTSDIVLLIPTASYMAYANEHSIFDSSVEMLTGVVPAANPEDLFLNEHREYGLSLYDLHADGSGVCYSSRVRPLLTMRPGYTMPSVGPGGSGLWQFSADLHITNWLEAGEHRYDVITDEDLHREGPAILEPYRVVMTGSHPEYYSTPMWDAMQAYLTRGGRLMYLGANGFYWRIAFNDDQPGAIELRRAEDGVRAWEAEPGEYYHSFTGEYGGLWRRLGRPPQMLVGVGFSGQGFDVSSYFRRNPDSYDPRVAFVFEGVEEEIIGDFGVLGNGAAGFEVDRYDPALGSPPNALRSRRLGRTYQSLWPRAGGGELRDAQSGRPAKSKGACRYRDLRNAQ